MILTLEFDLSLKTLNWDNIFWFIYGGLKYFYTIINSLCQNLTLHNMMFDFVISTLKFDSTFETVITKTSIVHITFEGGDRLRYSILILHFLSEDRFGAKIINFLILILKFDLLLRT